MYEAHDAVLHAVSEGLLSRRPRRAAWRWPTTRPAGCSGCPPRRGPRGGRPRAARPPFADLLALRPSRRPGRCILARRPGPAGVAGGGRRGKASVLGTVTTVRDTTELMARHRRAGQRRSLAEALRSQAHESANRLHTVITLVELGRPEEAVELGIAELQASQALTDRVLEAVEEPVLAALLLGKAAEASERGIELRSPTTPRCRGRRPAARPHHPGRQPRRQRARRRARGPAARGGSTVDRCAGRARPAGAGGRQRGRARRRGRCRWRSGAGGRPRRRGARGRRGWGSPWSRRLVERHGGRSTWAARAGRSSPCACPSRVPA